MMDKIILYVGTYTRPADYLLQTNGQGIYTFEFDAKTGQLSPIRVMKGIDNPSFLSVTKDHKYLYANSEVPEWHEGLVTAFAIDQSNGELTYINKQSSLGNTSSYNIVEESNQYLLMTNYGDRHGLAMFAINDDGSLSPASDSHEIIETPAGTVPHRQDRSRLHCVVVDPSNQYALVNDLGLDKIFIYRLDLESGRFIPQDLASIAVDAGSGPRHTVFHPNGQYIYISLELSSSVLVCKFNSTTGELSVLQKISALPDDYTHESHCSDINVTPTGNYLYVGNRGHDSLTIYKINSDTGLLSLVGHQPSKGQTPRNFVIDPSGEFVLVANQDSDNIVVFRINQDTGELTETGIVMDCPTPVCLKFAIL